MPRNHTTATSTLRNRNRVTNKTRLKVVRGNIDADPLVLDEEEEKARVVSTAGVDAEDANEHHLQAVLSAASQRHQNNTLRSSRGNEKVKEAPAAYIPVPDSREILEGYSDAYPSGRWVDPFNYIRSSESVEESIRDGIANGFTYFMDERDQEWLEKNSEEARGEGTSTQGAVSSGGTGTRSSQRSAKWKGKEPDVSSPIAMTEDEFELVMGIFEKVTHDKTEYLHHGLEQGGMSFPPFSDYQDTFATKLSPSLFATFVVPDWVPEPAQLLRLAKVIYPYWRDRRLERGGHRIIPALNLDEADMKNESFICFRRRELKAVRKTRASQVSYSDKLVRLKSELALSLDLSGHVHQREMLKRDTAQQAQQVWEKRLAFVELKMKFPALGAKEDEELLFDKERVAKKARTDASISGRMPPSIKLRTRDSGEIGSPSPHVEAAIKPRDRTATINKQIERDLAAIKERDHHWEDGIDVPYQSPPLSWLQRAYKFSTSTPSSPDEAPVYRAIRRRVGRGGRTWMDRRTRPLRLDGTEASAFEYTRYQPRFPQDGEVDEAAEQERAWRVAERWKYDADDDIPVIGPDGAEESDRILVDDYDPKYLREAMSLFGDQDIQALSNDPTITIVNAEGRSQSVIPFKLGITPSMRREMQRPHAMGPPHPGAVHPNSISLTMPSGSGAPVSLPTHLKMMQGGVRISSSIGLQRGLPTVPIAQPNVPPMQSPPHALPVHSQPSNSNLTVSASASVQSAASTPAADANGSAIPHGQTQNVANHAGQVDGVQPLDRPSSSASNSSPVRPSSQTQSTTPVNGYHVTGVNGFPNPLPNGSPYVHHGNLSPQQVEVIKNVFPPVQPGQGFSIPVNGGMQPRPPSSYVGHVASNGVNFNVPLSGSALNLNLPPKRQMQWANHHPQRPPSVNGQHGNGMDASQLMHMTGSMSPPNQNIAVPHSMAGLPGRVPSRAMIGRPSSVVQGSPANIAHLTPHSSSPLLHNVNISSPQIHSSPPRQAHTPMASPSMQHQQTQQVVGGAPNGF
ncbi:hypothetical protein NEOLEDRAFT_1072458 [Neolentinus lepideus HHB14362 ss-1]|uniref:Enhancer of polycomb-like protein n=1 Tax=Neolentinus lepideus HHB14362 ss-1 TaxID=1314782 RepID=A0A165Q6H1_9AGAM|nr:hypothetical protein NEOLEDRAFT_1072458 [Neolentinus lepideus HHB14362 ss-1]